MNIKRAIQKDHWEIKKKSLRNPKKILTNPNYEYATQDAQLGVGMHPM